MGRTIMNRAVLLICGWIGRAMEAWLVDLGKPLVGEVAAQRERHEKLRAENELLRERFGRLDAHARPQYKPWERLAILAHRERYGMSLEATAKAFLVSDQTLENLLAEVEQEKPRLVQTKRPVNALPDLVREIGARLKREWPSWGTRRIAGILARLGLKASRTSVQRLLRRPPPRPAKGERRPARGALVARKPVQVWVMDFTVNAGGPTHGILIRLLEGERSLPLFRLRPAA